VKLPWRRAAPDPSPAPGPVSPDLLAWVGAVDVTLLSDKTVRTAESFLRDYRHLGSLSSRRESALRLRAAIEAQLSPPPPPTASSMDVIAAVLSAHRQKFG
jgi:hypothetical protein